MQGFKSYHYVSPVILTEKVTARWVRSSFLNMMSGLIPLTNAIYKEIDQKQVRKYFWHSTSINAFPRLANIQLSNKSISARLAPSVGVWEQGLLIKLAGTMLFGSDQDIGSVPDENGRRWTSVDFVLGMIDGRAYSRSSGFAQKLSQLFRKEHQKHIAVGFVKMRQKFDRKTESKYIDALNHLKNERGNIAPNMGGKLLKTVEYGTFNLGSEPEIWEEIIKRCGTIMRDMLAKWIEVTQKMIGRFVDRIVKNVLNISSNIQKRRSEIVVNKIKIDSVGIENLPNKRNMKDGDAYNAILDIYNMVEKTTKNARVYYYNSGNLMPSAQKTLEDWLNLKDSDEDEWLRITKSGNRLTATRNDSIIKDFGKF